MKTTQLYVEQVIIGLLVLMALGLFIMPIFFCGKLVEFVWFRGSIINLADASLIVMAAYLLGMIYDRVADTILEATDLHNRLRFALKGTARRTKDGAEPAVIQDLFPEDVLRIKAMKDGEASNYMEYLRSRMRLMRALSSLIPLYTVIASLYQVTELKLPLSNRPLWISGGILMLFFYGLVLLVNANKRFRKWSRIWQLPPKTGDVEEVDKYAKSHIDKASASPIWRKADCCRDPAWWGFTLVIITSISILVESGRFARYWPIPVAGVLLTLLTGWVWLRVSNTFMKFITDFSKHSQK